MNSDDYDNEESEHRPLADPNVSSGCAFAACVMIVAILGFIVWVILRSSGPFH